MRKRFWRKRPLYLKRPPINEYINAVQLRVVDDQGKMLGILEKQAAVDLAKKKGLDLIVVNPTQDPPIAKIVDYGKYKYLQEKGSRGKKNKKASAPELKTVRISLKTGEHDLQIKSQATDKFLKKGHKVRIEIFLKGRERAFRDLAKQKLNAFLLYLTLPHLVEEDIKPHPRGLALTIRPEAKK